MIDRELLELAAKAADLQIMWSASELGGILLDYGATSDQPIHHWNPLTDDGDALRLAVKLKLTPHLYKEHNTTLVATDAVSDPEGFDVIEKWGDDPCAATRRAIVRAAAEIGEGIKQVISHDLPDEDNYSGSVWD